jgi:hypothetical protein
MTLTGMTCPDNYYSQFKHWNAHGKYTEENISCNLLNLVPNIEAFLANGNTEILTLVGYREQEEPS